MENKIIDLIYIKTLNDINMNKFEFNDSNQFKGMLDKLFKTSVKDHYLFKDLYNKKRYIYSVTTSSSKTDIRSNGTYRIRLTLYHDLEKESLNALFLEKDNYTYFIYFEKNILYSKYKNQTLTTKMEVNEHLIPLKDNHGLFPNGQPKVTEEFNSEYAVKITTHYSLKGKEYKKIVELRNNMFATIFRNKKDKLEIQSNNIELENFLEEHLTSIQDFNDVLPLIELNFI